MNKIQTDEGIYRIAASTGANAALLLAVQHMTRYHFEPIRPDLLPDMDSEDDGAICYFPHITDFKREELGGCNATVKVIFRKVVRVREIFVIDKEPLYIYRPDIEISWTTSLYTPEQAVLAGRIIGDAGIAAIGLPGAMGGVWTRTPAVFPNCALDDDQLDKLLNLIGVSS